jgi:Protein of unknown function (DUF3592)
MRFRFTSEPERHGDDAFGTKVIVTKHVGKIVAAVFVAVFLIFAGVGWALWSFGGKNAALMAEGAVQVVARVEMLEMERQTQRDTTGNSTGTRTTYDYYAHVIFADQAGREQRARLSIGKTDYNTLQQGQDLPLRYAAADPSVVELREGDLAAGAALGYWLMLGGLMGVVVTLVIGLVRSRRPAVL